MNGYDPNGLFDLSDAFKISEKMAPKAAEAFGRAGLRIAGGGGPENLVVDIAAGALLVADMVGATIEMTKEIQRKADVLSSKIQAAIQIRVKDKEKNDPDKVWLMYTKEAADGTICVGRTSGKGDPQKILEKYDASWLRTHENQADKQWEPARLDKDSKGLFGYFAIRGREQQLIDENGGALSDNKNDPSATDSANTIRGVAKSNILGPIYHEATNQLWGEKHAYTGDSFTKMLVDGDVTTWIAENAPCDS